MSSQFEVKLCNYGEVTVAAVWDTFSCCIQSINRDRNDRHVAPQVPLPLLYRIPSREWCLPQWAVLSVSINVIKGISTGVPGGFSPRWLKTLSIWQCWSPHSSPRVVKAIGNSIWQRNTKSGNSMIKYPDIFQTTN